MKDKGLITLDQFEDLNESAQIKLLGKDSNEARLNWFWTLSTKRQSAVLSSAYKAKVAKWNKEAKRRSPRGLVGTGIKRAHQF